MRSNRNLDQDIPEDCDSMLSSGLHQASLLGNESKSSKSNANSICPHHPMSVLWYWGSRCAICRTQSDELSSLRIITGSSESRVRSVEASLSFPSFDIPQASRRDRRRSRAVSKFPYTYPRKGSDTNPNSLTGRILSIYREGLSTIGRTFTPASTPWKC